MLGISPWHTWCFSFLLLIPAVTVIKACVQQEKVNTLSSTGPGSNSLRPTISSRHKRHDAWNPTDIFLCEEDAEDSIFYSLTCDKSHVCTMITSSAYKPKIIQEILALDMLTDNCSQPFNPFYTTHAGRAANVTNLRFTVAQAEVLEMKFFYTNFTHFPPGYFCKLTNATSLSITYNTIEASRDLGLAGQCGTSGCCLCGLQHLTLANNHLQKLDDFGFCDLSSLRSLVLSRNSISHMAVNAFATLGELSVLNMDNNLLRALPENIFAPVGSLKSLYLHGNMLSEISLAGLGMLEDLDLSYNNISELCSDSFKDLKNLKKLLLISNKLVRLGEAMRALESIVVLDLSGNFLLASSELEFSSMSNLSRLILSRNKFTEMGSLTISEFADVREIDLSGNMLTSIPDLTAIKKVGFLNLSNNKIRSITSTDRAMLCNMTLVQIVYLGGNLIEVIVPNAFDCNDLNNSLEILSLKNNKITDVSNAFQKSKIKELNLSGNLIEALSLADMSPSIEKLDASKNSIKNFSGIHPSDAYSSNNFHLKELELRSNLIEEIYNAYFPQTLEQLILKANKLRHLSVAKLEENTSASIILPNNIKRIDVSFNKIQYMCPLMSVIHRHEHMPEFIVNQNPFFCQCELDFMEKHHWFIYSYGFPMECISSESMNLSKHAIVDPSQLHRADQFSCKPKHPKRRGICQCNLHSAYNTICGMPCPGPCRCFLNSGFDSQVINCTNRHLSTIPNTTPVREAIKLYFSNNLLTSLGPASLKQYGSAKEIYFANNRLTAIHQAAFQYVPGVVVLHLQSNLLTNLQEGIFQNLTDLAELFLSGNGIVVLPGDIFRPLIRLGVLHLNNNLLEDFPVWNLQDPEEGQLRVTLRDNPWQCECGYVDQFRGWLQNFSSRVDDASSLFCTSDDGQVSQIPLISYNLSHCYELSLPVSIFQNVPLWSSCLAVLLLLLVISTMVFIYRAEVQVLVYSRYGLRIFHHQEEPDDADKLYDAFIAFSSFDDVFVVEHVLPGLEQIDNPYKTCVHQRDFMVGAIITESILEAVEVSRRTIIILSEHFVKSGWCRFEFKSAHMKMLTDRCSRVIIIVLDDVPKNLDPEMQLYMKTNTYLKWGDPLFWQKLYFAMPDKKRKRCAASNIELTSAL